MSQAERESSETEERITGPFMVNPKFDTEELRDEAEQRIDIVRGFLNLLACGHVGNDGSFAEDIEAVAYGHMKLLDEAKALQQEHEQRLWERDRPRREAAEKRAKQARTRARCVQMFTDLEVRKGANKATARKLAMKTVAELEAGGPLDVEPAASEGRP